MVKNNKGIMRLFVAFVLLSAFQACRINIVDARNGTIYDRNPLPGRPLFSVGTTVTHNGTILVPTFNGYLYAFSAED